MSIAILRFLSALIAVIIGIYYCVRGKQPLFFKILLFGCASFLLGAVFEGCWTAVYKAPPVGFHIGYLGYMGAYFFLLSSHYGAINRLADGGEKQFRPYRMAALLGPLVVVGILVWSFYKEGLVLPLVLLAIPITFELYFAIKHLLLPDVDMGIIKVMRPYNLCVSLLCIIQLIGLMPGMSSGVTQASEIGVCIIFVILLPMAQVGVKKWFM